MSGYLRFPFLFLGLVSQVSALNSNGESILLGAEELYKAHAPSRAVLQSVFLRLYNGDDPEAAEVAEAAREAGEKAQDPAKHLPEHGIKELEPKHEEHKKDAVLFEREDLTAWLVFTMVFFVLIFFDNFILHRDAAKLTLLQSILYTTFWIAIAGMFGIYVWYTRGPDDAFSWGTGYLLEWMLSVDNLFVFHRIFIVFKTPDEQKHKPLFYGIIGAVIFRMAFFFIEEILLHHVTWMHLVFGLFLIYTGFKAVSMDDDDESPDQGPVFQAIIQHINYVDRYDEKGRFFTMVEVTDEKTGKTEMQCRATRLVLVVICLEVTDLVFAVDSVSAIVAQIPDLFLAYTACVFAMLGLRAMFFAIDELVKMFSLLGYGVAFILIFIGTKLILRSWIHIPPKIVCFILVTTLVVSVIASLVQDRMEEEDKGPPEDTECPGAQ